jgi:hypothetical protein
VCTDSNPVTRRGNAATPRDHGGTPDYHADAHADASNTYLHADARTKDGHPLAHIDADPTDEHSITHVDADPPNGDRAGQDSQTHPDSAADACAGYQCTADHRHLARSGTSSRRDVLAL